MHQKKFIIRFRTLICILHRYTLYHLVIHLYMNNEYARLYLCISIILTLH